jgi:hypothetical protein
MRSGMAKESAIRGVNTESMLGLPNMEGGRVSIRSSIAMATFVFGLGKTIL